MENALVRQKDFILSLINNEEYEKALSLIGFSEELWASVNYAYKTRELRQRVLDDIRIKMIECHHKTYQKWSRIYNSIPV